MLTKFSESDRVVIMSPWKPDDRVKARKIAKRARLARVGLTREQFLEQKRRQSNRCAICGRKFYRKQQPINLDHCHRCKRFRGLLCRRCNMGLGYFKDSIPLLARAIVYLEDHPSCKATY